MKIISKSKDFGKSDPLEKIRFLKNRGAKVYDLLTEGYDANSIWEVYVDGR